MKYKIVKKEAFTVVGVKFEVEMVGDELSPTYEEMFLSIGDSKLEDLSKMSTKEPDGLVHVTTNYQESENGKASFDQYIGAVTDREKAGEYSVLEVSSLLWAIFEIDGDWEEVNDQWQRIYTEWLPGAPYELAEGPEILASRDELSEIWIPVKSKN